MTNQKTTPGLLPPVTKPLGAVGTPATTAKWKQKTKFKTRPTAETKVTFDPAIIPNVTITKEALDKMRLYVEEMEKEIGWLGTTERIGNDITITDVYLFKQEVHATTTEITSEGLADFAAEILQNPEGMEIWNNMKMWGHSHVRMGITPSAQDDQQMNEFKQAGHDYFIRLIANKMGELKIDVYEYDKGLEFHNVPWVVEATEEHSVNLSQIDQLKAQMDLIQKQIDDTQKEIENAIESEIETKRVAIAEEIKQKVSELRPVYQYHRPGTVPGGPVNPPSVNDPYKGWTKGTGAGAPNYVHQDDQGNFVDVQGDIDPEPFSDQEIAKCFKENTIRSFLTFKEILTEFGAKELTSMQNHCLTIAELRYDLYFTGYAHLTSEDVDFIWTYLQNYHDSKNYK